MSNVTSALNGFFLWIWTTQQKFNLILTILTGPRLLKNFSLKSMEKSKPGSVIYITCTKRNFKQDNSVYYSTFFSVCQVIHWVQYLVQEANGKLIIWWKIRVANEIPMSKVSVAEKTSWNLSTNYKNINEKIIEMEINMHKLKQYSRRECIEIAGISSWITKDLLGKPVLLIFEKLAVVLEAMDIVACHRLRKTKRVFVKPLNRKDSQDILEEKYKLRNIVLYNHDESKNNRRRKIFINQSLYYRKLYGSVKDLNNESLIDSFWLLNGTIKIRESSQSKLVSVTHESDLQF